METCLKEGFKHLTANLDSQNLSYFFLSALAFLPRIFCSIVLLLHYFYTCFFGQLWRKLALICFFDNEVRKVGVLPPA